MNSAPITPGCSSGASSLLTGVILLACSGAQLWFGILGKPWYAFLSGVGFLIAGCVHLGKWRSYRRGAWQIQWEGTHVRILDHGRVDYEGELAGLERIDQDGRGYFLGLVGGIGFQLRRGDSPAEFEALLDKCQEERR